MKKLLILVIGVFLISNLLAASSNFKMIKNLTVSGGESYPNSVMSWGGTIKIDRGANVEGSVILIGGQLELDGVVEEDVICVATTIKLGEKAYINGDLFVIGGKLEPDDKVAIKKRVEGEYLNFKINLKKIESTLLPIFSDSQSIALFKAIKIIFWLIVTLIVLAVVPRKINLAKDIFETHLFKVGAIGIISLFSFLCLLFIFIILCFIIIGIPLLFILVIAYFITYIFGRTVMFYFIGTKVADRLKWKNISPAFFIVIGVVIYGILKFVPYVGPILLIIMNICEIGIGIGFFFRKKLKFEA